MIFSWVASFLSSSPTNFPWFITNVTNLIAQNGHVVILAVGMLMCILTGGNIDLSVGSHMPRISGSSDDIMMMDFPSFASELIML